MAASLMTEGKPWKHILRFSLPIAGGFFLQQLYNISDSIIVGRFLGESALSAVGTCNNFIFLLTAIGLGFSIGNGILVANAFGAKKDDDMRKAAAGGIVFLLLLGLLTSLFSILISRPAFIWWIGVPPQILSKTITYFRTYAAGFFFLFGYNIITAVLRSVGDSAASLIFLVISSILNILLDILFIVSFNMGVFGAAIATVISQTVSFVVAWFYMIKRYPVFCFKLSDLKWDKTCVKETCKVGFPIFLQLGIMSFGLTFIQRAANSFGQQMTAAFTVLQRVELYIFIPYISFSNTLATFTAQNMGAGKFERIKKGTYQTVGMSFIVSLTAGLLVYVFAPQILALFGLQGEAAAYGLKLLKTVSLIDIMLSLYNPVFGLFQGIKKSEVSTYVAVFVLAARILITYTLKSPNLLGESVICWNPLFGFSTGLIITWAYYFSGKWAKAL